MSFSHHLIKCGVRGSSAELPVLRVVSWLQVPKTLLGGKMHLRRRLHREKIVPLGVLTVLIALKRKFLLTLTLTSLYHCLHFLVFVFSERGGRWERKTGMQDFSTYENNKLNLKSRVFSLYLFKVYSLPMKKIIWFSIY